MPTHSSTPIDFEAINRAARRVARALLQDLLPGGKFKGSQYIVRNPNRDDRQPGSFTINHKTGTWKDFASGEGGGDFVSLHANVWHCGQSVAAMRVADKLGVPVTKAGCAKAQKASAGAASRSAPKIHLWGNDGPPIRKDEIRRHLYPRASETAVKIKIKYRNSKFVTWYRVFEDGNLIGWQPKKPDNFTAVPYVADAELKGDKILWPEGENDVDTLSRSNLPAFTFGGTGDGLPEGLEPYLKDRHIVILADNDDAGRLHAEKKANAAHHAGAASIRVVHFSELRAKGDVSDFLAHGGTVEQLNARIDATPLWPPPESTFKKVHAHKTEGQWPIMDEAGYQGLAGEIVKTIGPQTESDPNAILVQVLGYFGNVVGNSAYYKVEADHHHANLFTVLVGQSAKGRKGTSAGHACSVMKSADEIWLGERRKSGLSSGEGLINEVRDEVKKWDVAESQLQTIDPGVADKRLMIAEPEFAGALAAMERSGNTLSPIIRNAWDGQTLSTLTKTSPLKATGAHISIVGHITEDELRRRLTRTDIANGFANRFLFVSVRRSKLLPHGGNLDEAELAGLGERVKAAVAFAKKVGRVRMTEAARREWEAIYPHLSKDQPGLVGAITARAEAQTIRLALIYALLDCKDEIDVVHLRAGIAVWEYCEASAVRIFGNALGDPVADKILNALRQAGDTGMTRTAIRDLFHRHQHEGRITQALELLESTGRARMEMHSTNGRSTETWFAVEGR
jgi:hypothetical protein